MIEIKGDVDPDSGAAIITIIILSFISTALLISVIIAMASLPALTWIFYLPAVIATACALGYANSVLRRHRKKGFAQRILADGVKTKATIKGISLNTYLRQGKGGGQVYSLSMTYEFSGINRIAQELKLSIFFPWSSITVQENPSLLHPFGLKITSYPLNQTPEESQICSTLKQQIDAGKEINFYALWRNFCKLKEGDTLSVVYNPDKPSVNYPEVYLQALAGLRGVVAYCKPNVFTSIDCAAEASS